MKQPTGPEPLRERIPVGIIIEHSVYSSGRWTSPRHALTGVVCGEAVRAPAPEATLLREQGEVSQHLWKGFEIRLYPDAAESYWFNLTSAEPMLFVVCRDDDEEGFTPALVTVDHDEANAHLETDDHVLTIALPPELHPLLERYVLEHYQPAPMKKRRRTKWGDDEGSR